MENVIAMLKDVGGRLHFIGFGFPGEGFADNATRLWWVDVRVDRNIYAITAFIDCTKSVQIRCNAGVIQIF